MSNQCHLVDASPVCIAINGNIEEINRLLITAVQEQSEDLVNLLLDHGANINATDGLGRPPLYFCFKFLYTIHEERPSFFEQGYSTWNRHAARHMIKLLLERGADPNISKYKYFPLHTAIMDLDMDILNALLMYKADVNCQDSRQSTPLHIAVAVSLTGYCLHNLLACYNDIDIPTIDGQTPLYFANNSDVLSKLLSKKCNVNYIDNNGDTPLHYMCEKHDKLECIKMLLEHGANVNARNIEGQTPVHKLTKHKVWELNDVNSVDIVKELLKYNADINAFDNEGNTPLILACEQISSESIFEAFLTCGAEVNCNDKYGKTPLHLAIESLQNSKINMLLRFGADINIFCNDNKTSLDYLKLKVDKINANNSGSVTFRRSCIAEKISFIFNSLRDRVIGLKCAGLHVDNKNIDLFYNDNEFINAINAINACYNCSLRFNDADIAGIENECIAEISELKNTIVGGIALNKLITKNLHDIIKFTEYKELFSNLFQTFNIRGQFPLYIDIIRNRFNEAVEMSKIIEVVKPCFDSLEIINKLPLLCREKILRYLNFDDLRVLLKAAK